MTIHELSRLRCQVCGSDWVKCHRDGELIAFAEFTCGTTMKTKNGLLIFDQISDKCKKQSPISDMFNPIKKFVDLQIPPPPLPPPDRLLREGKEPPKPRIK